MTDTQTLADLLLAKGSKLETAELHGMNIPELEAIKHYFDSDINYRIRVHVDLYKVKSPLYKAILMWLDDTKYDNAEASGEKRWDYDMTDPTRAIINKIANDYLTGTLVPTYFARIKS